MILGTHNDDPWQTIMMILRTHSNDDTWHTIIMTLGTQ